MLSSSTVSRAQTISVINSNEETGKTVSDSPSIAPTTQLDKTEINDAVTKVLQGYDWTLVPIATK